ncbi:MAG: protein kinase [Planctomycetaceae bacterium]
MEPPSAPLQKLLEECGLCDRADLRRCQSRVRRLARDLPTFDSVWLDALLQARILTGYQARVLSSNTPGRIRVGPWVLEERLGGGAWSETFRASLIGKKAAERRVLKRLVVPSDVRAVVGQRLQQLVTGSAKISHSGIVAPRIVQRIGAEIVLGSSFVEGSNLTELLVRRGRFPAAVVGQIGRALVESLAELETIGQVHGDLLLTNVKLTPGGDVVAVDAGVSAAIQPALVIDTTRSPECYDGTAPERIESLGAATPASDLYALGCLLFELLAGRPPFPVADPVMKVAAHQSREVADVRSWAPETPRWLAEAIGRLCAHEAEARPDGFSAALGEWGKTTRRARREVADFVERFRSAAPSGRGPAGGARQSVGKRISVAVVASVLLAGVGSWILAGKMPGEQLLLMLKGSARSVETSTKSSAVPAGTRQQRQQESDQAWPACDSQGRVRLDSSRTWRAATVSRVGGVIVEGADHVKTQICIESGRPLTITAPVVVLRNLVLRGPASGPWLRISAGVVRLEQCLLHRENSTAPAGADSASAAIVISNGDVGGGVFVGLRSVVVQHDGVVLRVRSDDAEVVASNLLQLGGRAWLEWDSGDKKSGQLYLRLNHCTFRRSGGLLSWMAGRVHAEVRSTILAIRSGDVVFDHRGTGPASLVVRGSESLLTPGIVVCRKGGMVEGMVAAVPTFRGPPTRDPQDSTLSRLPAGVPEIDGRQPGIQSGDGRGRDDPAVDGVSRRKS